MTFNILLTALVVLFCVLLNRLSYKIGIPMLLTFIALGMAFGTDGFFKIPFESYAFAEQVCSAALIFIMFYGGFGTNWNQARPVAVRSFLLSTLGVVLTAGLTGLFCHLALNIPLLESLLIGAVVSSTDAASVFAILRSKRLGLKYNTDSMLELESGSNDHCSYMLTVLVLTLMHGGVTGGTVVGLVLAQFGFGILAGVAVAFGAVYFLRHFNFSTDGYDMAFAVGAALLAYACAALIGGNGYLSTYICGILLGNLEIRNKKALVHFFDGVTGLMQMLIFFLLGLLSTPSRLPAIFLPALGIMLFLTLVARPVSVFAILTPFRCPVRQQLLVSFAGLRGAASIVFAIMATMGPTTIGGDLFHIVFCVVLLSIAFQGSLLAPCAKALSMSDKSIDVMKTFSDYSEEAGLHFIQVRLPPRHPWVGRTIRDATLPPDTLIVLLLRNGESLIPNGSTVLQANDVAVLSAHRFDGDAIELTEHRILPGSRWIGKTILDFSPRPDELVVMVLRGQRTILPKGDTVIHRNDVLVVSSHSENE